MSDQQYKVPGQTRIGHVHLKVSNLQRSLDFYCGVLGFELIYKMRNQAAFISAGGYHHHIGLNTWHSENAEPAPVRAAGLYHIAILYPTRQDLAVAVRRVLENQITLTGAADHGVSEAIYLNDPDRNGVELYWDRPRDQWPTDESGNLVMITEALDLNALLRQASGTVA